MWAVTRTQELHEENSWAAATTFEIQPVWIHAEEYPLYNKMVNADNTCEKTGACKKLNTLVHMCKIGQRRIHRMLWLLFRSGNPNISALQLDTWHEKLIISLTCAGCHLHFPPLRHLLDLHAERKIVSLFSSSLWKKGARHRHPNSAIRMATCAWQYICI